MLPLNSLSPVEFKPILILHRCYPYFCLLFLLWFASNNNLFVSLLNPPTGYTNPRDLREPWSPGIPSPQQDPKLARLTIVSLGMQTDKEKCYIGCACVYVAWACHINQGCEASQQNGPQLRPLQLKSHFAILFRFCGGIRLVWITFQIRRGTKPQGV